MWMSSFFERGRGAVNEYTQRVIPLTKALVQTTRVKVELLKKETERLESDFESARNSLSEANKILESTRSDLQRLYYRRDFEYRKSKSDVKVIREINEQENKLKEQEEEHQRKVDECTRQELELYNLTRSSNQKLYDTTQNYAKRYIAIGISVGTLFSMWKGYQYISGNLSESEMNARENESINDDLLNALNDLKVETDKIHSANAKLNSMLHGIKTTEELLHARYCNQNSSSEVVMYSLSTIVAIGLSAGLTGGCLPLLLNFVYSHWLS